MNITPFASQVSFQNEELNAMVIQIDQRIQERIQDSSRDVYIEEMNSLNKERFRLIGLIAELEVLGDPDLQQLKHLEQLIDERILKIRDLVKHILCRNTMDLTSEDDLHCPPASFRTEHDPIPLNSRIGYYLVPDSLAEALKIEDPQINHTALKRSLLVAVSGTILEHTLLAANPLIAASGIALTSTLLYFHRREIVQLKSDIQRTSPVCKLILTTLPLFGIASPLLLLKSWSLCPLSLPTIGNIALSALAGLSPRVQHNKRKIDAYALLGNEIYWKGICYKENSLNNESTFIMITKNEGVKIAQLKKQIAHMEGILK